MNGSSVGNTQLFVCTACGCVDVVDTAHTSFNRYLQEWRRLSQESGVAADNAPQYQPYTCTACLTGEWHDQFPRLAYDPSTDDVINPPIPMK